MSHKQIFINLPIKNMAKSRAFFESLGYQFNPQFSNDQGACLVLGENLFGMLLTEPLMIEVGEGIAADVVGDQGDALGFDEAVGPGRARGGRGHDAVLVAEEAAEGIAFPRGDLGEGLRGPMLLALG